jgi:hypothetical protein
LKASVFRLGAVHKLCRLKICEILATIAQLLGVVEKLSFFESAILNFFCFVFILNSSQINGYQGWEEILMITLISSKKIGVYKIMRNTVGMKLKFKAECHFSNGQSTQKRVKSMQ